MSFYSGPPKALYITVGTSTDDSGDLEPSTKNITATSKQASADYTCTNALTSPTDSRFTVSNIGYRLVVDIDNFGVASLMTVNVDFGSTTVLTATYTAAGAAQVKGANETVTSDSGRSATQAKIFFWVNAGTVVLSKVQLQIAYGTYGNNYLKIYTISSALKGFINPIGRASRYGSGNIYLYFGGAVADIYRPQYQMNNAADGTTFLGTTLAYFIPMIKASDNMYFYIYAAGATDLAYWDLVALQCIETR